MVQAGTVMRQFLLLLIWYDTMFSPTEIQDLLTFQVLCLQFD